MKFYASLCLGDGGGYVTIEAPDRESAREMIDLLKRHAFKWSPSNMAWQRQLTNNAIYAFNNSILPVLKGAEVVA